MSNGMLQVILPGAGTLLCKILVRDLGVQILIGRMNERDKVLGKKDKVRQEVATMREEPTSIRDKMPL